jgi:hypothetical protein
MHINVHKIGLKRSEMKQNAIFYCNKMPWDYAECGEILGYDRPLQRKLK